MNLFELFVFLSTPPSRVATTSAMMEILLMAFLSTPPSRVATLPAPHGCRCFEVSIHATLAGGDDKRSIFYICTDVFLSTPPSRVATVRCLESGYMLCVSIHATLAGGDTLYLAFWQFLA